MDRGQGPFPYIERARRRAAIQGTEPYQYAENQDAPWTPLAKAVARCRVGLVSTAGVFCLGQQPFLTDGKDLSFREVPMDTPQEKLDIRHEAYDETQARKDINVVLPIRRLREMAEADEIGGATASALTFVGRIYSRRRVQKELAPALLERLRGMGAEVVLLVPV